MEDFLFILGFGVGIFLGQKGLRGIFFVRIALFDRYLLWTGLVLRPVYMACP